MLHPYRIEDPVILSAAKNLPRRARATPVRFVFVASAAVLWLLLPGCGHPRSEEHTSELQSRQYLHSFPPRRSSDLYRWHGLPAHVFRNATWAGSPCYIHTESRIPSF